MIILADTPIWVSLVASLGPAILGGVVGALVTILVQRSAHKRTTIDTKRAELYKSYQIISRLVITYEHAMHDFSLEITYIRDREELASVEKSNRVEIDQALKQAQEATAAYLYIDAELKLYLAVLELHSAYLVWKWLKVGQCAHRLDPTLFKVESPTDEEINVAWDKVQNQKKNVLELSKAWNKELPQ